MSLSINWATKVIYVPKDYTTLVQLTPNEIRNMDMDIFRQDLKDLEDSAIGMSFPDTHSHVAPISVGSISLARVVTIINGYTVEFEDGQYRVRLQNANTNLEDVQIVNQVSVSTNNSVGQSYSKELQDQSYSDSRVWIDTVNGQSAPLDFPTGLPASGAASFDIAKLIIEKRNLPRRLMIIGDETIHADDDISDYDIMGYSSKLSSLVVEEGANTNNLVLSRLKITGDINGNITARESTSIDGMTDFDGKLVNCGIGGTIKLAYSGKKHEFIDCHDEDAADISPTIDCADIDNLEIYFSRYSGSLRIVNFTGANNTFYAGFDHGEIIIESSCTAGSIKVSGNARITDNSGAGCTVSTVEVASYLVKNSLQSELDELDSATNSIETKIDTVDSEIGAMRVVVDATKVVVDAINAAYLSAAQFKNWLFNRVNTWTTIGSNSYITSYRVNDEFDVNVSRDGNQKPVSEQVVE